MKEQRVFKCIPLEVGWTIPGTKHDIKAIYRRPRRSVGEYDEVTQDKGPDGLPLYDIIGPLPLRRHSDWSAKGYEYVTVVTSPATEGSGWPAVAATLRAKGLNPQEYLQHPVFGTWNPKLYLATAESADRDKVDALRGMVEQFGSDVVTAIKRSEDPTFTLPAQLQGIPAGGVQLRTDVPSDIRPGEITDQAGYDAAKAAGAIAEIPAGSSAAKRITAQRKNAAKKKPGEVTA